MKTLLFLLLLIVVVGGGFYWYRSSSHSSLSSMMNSVTSSTTQGTTATSSMAAAMPAIDATWQTYRNKVVDFAFQYPTKGKFAPSFNVKVVPVTSKEIDQDGCYHLTTPSTPSEKKTLGGTDFCRSFSASQANGSTVDQEYWVTKQDKWYAVVTFSKKYVDVGAIEVCRNGSASTTARCQPFDLQAYRLQIEQIINTFAHTSTSPSHQ